MNSWIGRMVDASIAAVGRGMTDARQRVVEEGVYGKIVTPRVSSVSIQAPGEKSLSEAHGWTLPGGAHERGALPGWLQQHFGPDPSREAHQGGRDIHGNERDHGMER